MKGREMFRKERIVSEALAMILLMLTPVSVYAGELTTEEENDSIDYDYSSSEDSEYADGGYSDYGSAEADSFYEAYTYDPTESYNYLYGSMDIGSMSDIMTIIDGDLILNAASTYVPEIYQNPELPTGCESVALTIALEHYGFILDKTTIADDYLPYGSNYIWNYVGDPYSDNGACILAPGLSNAANAYLTDQGSSLYARDITGFEFTDLYKLVEEGYPVVVWTTMYMQEPSLSGSSFWYDGRGYEWYWNEHCVVLSGYDETTGTVTVSDPLDGIVHRDAAAFEYIYNLTGRNALVIM